MTNSPNPHSKEEIGKQTNMAQRRKQQGNSTELVNVRFYENQQRQALTTSDFDEGEGDDLSSVTPQVREDVEYDTEMNPAAVRPAAGSLLTPTQNASEEDAQTENITTGAEADSFGTSSTATAAAGFETRTSSTARVSAPEESLPVSAPTDKSRKGSVDQRIWKLVNLINSQKDSFFTTSSCSGRIILYTWSTGESSEGPADEGTERSKGLKKGCKWLLVSHDEVQPEKLLEAYFAYDGQMDLSFKMEPCILHVQCRLLSDARKLVHVATESGFRNSGMVIGKENRITVAIRSAMGLEVPLSPPQSQLTTSKDKSSCISAEYLNIFSTNFRDEEKW
ncbi:tRNA wybutosine-synthesizing protein 3 [Orchesella cincta]|uniref:tRNA wybutosine-synthesizing protein 3 homolog n=1 Tax=Orchesella cincta TaxID=48709 RepID=A0A1D2MWX5_ORCCI|nr:tRNA wybutosine-synthesizing protein 3 [Orchesella cincta]